MPTILKEIITSADFNAVADCLWESHYEPYITFMQILYPIFDHTSEGYQKAVASPKANLWAQHSQNKSSHWIAVISAETGEAFAGAHWNFHTVSPFVNGAPKLEATWHPEGEGREFASHILNRQHRILELDMMFTHPNHRRKGYGSMLMLWGMDIANEIGVEVIVEASDQGIHLYKKFGLRTIEKICIDTLVDNPSNLWKKMESDLGDVLIWWMWKPHGGIYEPGVTELPWVAKPL